MVNEQTLHNLRNCTYEWKQSENSKPFTYRQISSNILVRGVNAIATILIAELEFPVNCYRGAKWPGDNFISRRRYAISLLTAGPDDFRIDVPSIFVFEWFDADRNYRKTPLSTQNQITIFIKPHVVMVCCGMREISYSRSFKRAIEYYIVDIANC